MARIFRLCGILCFLQLIYHAAFCQKYLDDLGDAIEPQVQSLFGKKFEVHLIVDIDSSLNTRPFPRGPIEDPYNTLHKCSIFTAQNSNRAFIGIFKENRIIWHSDTIISIFNSTQHSILATMDLNNDGKVEIVCSWEYGMHYSEEALWIFCWDGQRGIPINDYDRRNMSTILSAGLFNLVDINADGIFEIQGIMSPETPNEKIVTYSWNGQKYGDWANPPQPLPSGYVPKNRLEAVVTAKVMRNARAFRYQFIIKNKPTSMQKINLIIMPRQTDSVWNGISPKRWEFSPLIRHLMGWRTLWDEDPIARGRIDSSFAFNSLGIPALVPCYVQGYNPSHTEPKVNRTTLQFDDEKWYQDIITNSFQGTTIGPTDPSSPFVPINFIDTIASYKHQSLALGWIKDRHIEQRLDHKLERVKRLLQMAETWPPGSSPLLDETEKALKEDDDECSREYGHEAVHEMPHPPLDEKRLNELGRFRGGQRWDKTERPDDNQRKEQYRNVLYWAAKQVLESFVREVEILNRLTKKSKQQYLTSEAYALLKFNAEYLIDQLQGKKK